jgi:hypothetical protein
LARPTGCSRPCVEAQAKLPAVGHRLGKQIQIFLLFATTCLAGNGGVDDFRGVWLADLSRSEFGDSVKPSQFILKVDRFGDHLRVVIRRERLVRFSRGQLESWTMSEGKSELVVNRWNGIDRANSQMAMILRRSHRAYLAMFSCSLE